MATKLHNLQSSLPKKKKKRLGRGDASGHGSYSTRGIKGQKARSGVSGLKLLGMKHIILSTPKFKGFTSVRKKTQGIALGQLDKFFNDGDIIDKESLVKKGLIKSKNDKVKIISSGELSKKITLKECKVSDSAKEKIESLGGKVE